MFLTCVQNVFTLEWYKSCSEHGHCKSKIPYTFILSQTSNNKFFCLRKEDSGAEYRHKTEKPEF